MAQYSQSSRYLSSTEYDSDVEIDHTAEDGQLPSTDDVEASVGDDASAINTPPERVGGHGTPHVPQPDASPANSPGGPQQHNAASSSPMQTAPLPPTKVNMKDDTTNSSYTASMRPHSTPMQPTTDHAPPTTNNQQPQPQPPPAAGAQGGAFTSQVPAAVQQHVQRSRTASNDVSCSSLPEGLYAYGDLAAGLMPPMAAMSPNITPYKLSRSAAHEQGSTSITVPIMLTASIASVAGINESLASVSNVKDDKQQPQQQHGHQQHGHQQQQQQRQEQEQQQQQLALSQRQLAAVIERSIEFSHAAERIQQLQQHVDTLTQRLSQAMKARDKAESALVEQAQQQQVQEQRLRDMYEARLADKQREVVALRMRVEKLEAQGTKGKLLNDSVEVKLSDEELSALRRNIEEQEVLIRGYQQENEVAVRRIKELEEQLQRQEELVAVESLRAERQALLAHDEGRVSNADKASRLKQILALQQEMQGLQEQWAVREGEMKQQIEKLRSEKKELEARLGGVDLQQIKEGDALVAAMRGEVEALRAQYGGMVLELQGKLRWYVENQELLSKNDALVSEQQDVIQRLEQRLAFYEGPQSKSYMTRIRELQAQVSKLSAALKGRQGTSSMAALIEACKPSPEESQLVQSLQAKVEQLTADMARKDEQYELQLRSYQQQYEQLRVQYEERASKAEAGNRQRRRTKELEQQIEDIRSTYTKKIRELEGRLKPAAVQKEQPSPRTSGANPNPHRAAGTDGGATSAQLRQKEFEIRKLQVELERKTKQVSELQHKLGEAEGRIIRLGEDLRRESLTGSPTLHVRSPISCVTPSRHHQHQQHQQHQQQQPGALHSHATAATAATATSATGHPEQSAVVQQLQQRVATLMLECDDLRQQLQTSKQAGDGSASAAALSAARAEVEALQRRVDAADLALSTVQRAHTQAVEKAALLQSEHQRTLIQVHDEIVYKEGVKWQQRLEQLQKELQSAQARVSVLEQELAATRARCSWTPEASQFAELERRLDNMAHEQAEGEAKWRAVLQDTKRIYEVQVEMINKRWELAMQSKNAEIDKFKVEVDALLTEARRLQQQQQQQQP